MSFWNGREWVDEGPPATDVKREGRVKHVAKAVLEAGLITALTFGLIAGSAFAARGGGGSKGGHGGGGNTGTGGTGTIALAALVVDKDASGTPNWGDVVRFDISTTLSQPWVYLTCSQGGTVVSVGSEGYFVGSLDDGDFGLYSPMWSGGAASCTATLKAYGGSPVASLTFAVGA
jgi:hypothetical protein